MLKDMAGDDEVDAIIRDIRQNITVVNYILLGPIFRASLHAVQNISCRPIDMLDRYVGMQPNGRIAGANLYALASNEAIGDAVAAFAHGFWNVAH